MRKRAAVVLAAAATLVSASGMAIAAPGEDLVAGSATVTAFTPIGYLPTQTHVNGRGNVWEARGQSWTRGLNASSAEARDARACRPRKSVTVAESSRGRVYSMEGAKRLASTGRFYAVTRWYGCLYSTGRPYFLGFLWSNAADLGLLQVRHYGFSLAGRYVAFMQSSAAEGGVGFTAVVRRDLRTGATLRDERPGVAAGDPADSPFVQDLLYYEPTDLVLRPTGAFAWIVANRSWSAVGPGHTLCGFAELNCRVFKFDRDGRVLLEEAGNIEPESLALTGSTVTWTSGGQQRSATLR